MASLPCGPAAPDLSIIIVNWNSKDDLDRCLASIRAQSMTIAVELIVVDSGSFDGCDEMLRRSYPEVRFFQSPDNIGFAAANNLGVRSARGACFLFLNPDTEVRGDAIQNLHRHLIDRPDAGVIGPRLLNRDGSLQTSGVQSMPTILNQLLDIEMLQRLFPNRDLWRTAAAFETSKAPMVVPALSGACMMVRRSVFDQVGRFSSDYFMYAEDLDLCWKTHRAGFRNFYDPTSNVIHRGGGSSRSSRSHFSEVMIPESLSRLLRKTHGALYSGAYRAALSAAALCRIALLSLLLPVVFVARKGRWIAALRKWIAILRWGLGMEKWVRDYGNPG